VRVFGTGYTPGCKLLEALPDDSAVMLFEMTRCLHPYVDAQTATPTRQDILNFNVLYFRIECRVGISFFSRERYLSQVFQDDFFLSIIQAPI
jgi:hypothetical protein